MLTHCGWCGRLLDPCMTGGGHHSTCNPPQNRATDRKDN